MFELTFVTLHHENTPAKRCNWSDLKIPLAKISYHGKHVSNCVSGQSGHVGGCRAQLVKTPQVNQQYEFSKRNSWKFSKKTSFSQRLLATTSSASPLKLKSKFLVRLRSKNRYRYMGISYEILNTGTGFFYLRKPRLWNAGHSLTNRYKLSPCHLQITNPYLESGTHAVESRIWHFVGFLTLDDIATLISLTNPTSRKQMKIM